MFNGADSAQNGNNANSFIATSGILPPDEFPQFESWASSRYDRPGGPFDPHTGELVRVLPDRGRVVQDHLPRNGPRPRRRRQPDVLDVVQHRGRLGLLFVEAAPAGTDNWTTLPDAMGHTSPSTGQSCPSGWFELHPWLERYQTVVSDT